MNKCWYKLNLKIDGALKDPWPLIKSGEHVVWSPRKELIFNEDWLSYMEEIGLPVSSHIMVFYRDVGWDTKSAHLDVETIKNLSDDIKLVTFAINWVLKGKNSSMLWYNLPNEKNKIQYTSVKSPYMSFPINTLSQIDNCNIQLEPVLVRVDMPHSISVGDEERWCISVRLKNFKELKWDEVVDYIRSKNLLIER